MSREDDEKNGWRGTSPSSESVRAQSAGASATAGEAVAEARGGLQTPTLRGGDGFTDETTMETPRQPVKHAGHPHPVLASMTALSMTESPRPSFDDPGTARPDAMSSRKSSLATLTGAKSPDLYEMASMYHPDEPTSLVVADANGGYFQNVKLSTPAVERFEIMGGASDWSNGLRDASSGLRNGHHTADQAEDGTYNPRKSTSTSSLADSVGTAGDATDSEYEDQRSRSHSRQGSRRPSAANLPSLAGKRLSSFAPIADISRNNSTTNVALHADHEPNAPSTSASPQISPPLASSSRSGRSQSLSPPAARNGFSSSMHVTTSNESSASSASSSASADATKAWQSVKGKQMEIVGIENKPENAPLPGKRKKHKPSPLDKVMSKTRPRDLPPKARDEDVRCQTGLGWSVANLNNTATASQRVRGNARLVTYSREKTASHNGSQTTRERVAGRPSIANMGKANIAKLESGTAGREA